MRGPGTWDHPESSLLAATRPLRRSRALVWGYLHPSIGYHQ